MALVARRSRASADLVIEDAEQVVAALGGREGEPGVAGAGVAREERAQDRRRIVLAFESLHEHFGDFVGALDAGGGAILAGRQTCQTRGAGSRSWSRRFGGVGDRC